MTAINDKKVIQSNQRLLARNYGGIKGFVSQINYMKDTPKASIYRCVRDDTMIYTEDRRNYLKKLGIPDRTISKYKGVDNLFNYIVTRDGLALYNQYKKKNLKR